MLEDEFYFFFLEGGGGTHFNILFNSYLLKKDISLDSFFHEKKNKNTDETLPYARRKMSRIGF